MYFLSLGVKGLTAWRILSGVRSPVPCGTETENAVFVLGNVCEFILYVALQNHNISCFDFHSPSSV